MGRLRVLHVTDQVEKGSHIRRRKANVHCPVAQFNEFIRWEAMAAPAGWPIFFFVVCFESFSILFTGSACSCCARPFFLAVRVGRWVKGLLPVFRLHS